jgi:hypothetical protein
MLTVNEIFHSIQGESTRAGERCVFVRLTACDLRCSWCDTPYAFYEGRKMSLDEVLEAVEAFDCPTVEITGGEPLLQKETPELMRRLLERGQARDGRNGRAPADRPRAGRGSCASWTSSAPAAARRTGWTGRTSTASRAPTRRSSSSPTAPTTSTPETCCSARSRRALRRRAVLARPRRARSAGARRVGAGRPAAGARAAAGAQVHLAAADAGSLGGARARPRQRGVEGGVRSEASAECGMRNADGTLAAWDATAPGGSSD